MKFRMRLLGLMMVCLVGWCPAAEAGPHPSEAGGHEARLWALAETAQQQLERSIPVLRDPVLDRFLEGMVTTLWRHTGSELPPVTIRILEQADPDARAYPNGVVYLTTGMLAHARNQDQLAMIVAHEIIHYTARHALNAFRTASRSSAGTDGGGHRHFADNARRVQRDMAVLCAEAEKQADREGLALMQAAGYRPEEALPLMAAFQATQTADGVGDGDVTPGQAALLRERTVLMQALVDAVRTDGPVQAPATAERDYQHHIAPALLANARAAMRTGHWPLAADSLRRYLSVMPDDAGAHYLRGEIQSRTVRNHEQALEAFQRAIGLDRLFAPAYRAIGMIHFKEGRMEQARRYFETSLALAPQAQENAYIKGYLQRCQD